jgi:alpha-galactosidase
LAKTPPMGWNNWSSSVEMNEKSIMQIADVLISSGMRDAGYEYVNLDNGWQIDRDKKTGKIIPDTIRFPHGIKYLADYCHYKGLKFGLYTDAGYKTCGGESPGSYGYESIDANTYAEWGVDFLKCDWCFHGTLDNETTYKKLADALYRTGYPIVFSLCEWGDSQPWLWAKNICHMWRTTGDINDNWDSMMGIVDKEAYLWPYAGPDHWNDADILQVGNGGMNQDGDKTHFTMWCMLASPLILGTDLRNMTKETKEILTNADMIAIDQDTLGKQAFRFEDDGDYEIWVKKLSGEEKAVCIINRSKEERNSKIDFLRLLNAEGEHQVVTRKYRLPDYKVYDLWKHEEITTAKEGMYEIRMPMRSVFAFRYIKK